MFLLQKNYQLKLDEKLKEGFFNTNKFLTMTTIGLFYCCKNVLILMDIWMIGKNSMKLYYVKKGIFTATYIWKILVMQITQKQKGFVKILK